MKISNIEEIKGYRHNLTIYKITFTPCWIGEFLGIKSKVKQYKDTKNTFTFGGGGIYINPDGSKVSNGSRVAEAIEVDEKIMEKRKDMKIELNKEVEAKK